MKWVYLIPLIIGVLGIFQGALLKNMALEIGMAHATLIGATITFLLSVGLFFLVRSNPQILPDFYVIKQPLNVFRWWYLIPGLITIFILLFFPKAMYELGAVKVTILVVAGQIIFSTFWDFFMENISFTLFKLLGILFAILSLVFTVL